MAEGNFRWCSCHCDLFSITITDLIFILILVEQLIRVLITQEQGILIQKMGIDLSFIKYKKMIGKDVQVRNQSFFRTIQAGDLSLFNIIDEAIALFGFTKAGKTTSSHYLSNQPLRAFQQQGRLIYQLAGQRYSTAVIGQTSESQTQIPNIFQTKYRESKGVWKTVVVLDQPGYSDSYGFHRILSNGYFHYRTFSKTPKLKFILTINKNGLEGTGDMFKKTLQIFMSTFTGYQQIKEDIMNASVILITQVDTESKLQDIHQTIKQLQAVRNNMTARQWQNYSQFIDHILTRNKLFVFRKPQNVHYQTKQNNMLKEMFEITSFWQRKVNNNIVDMSSINFSVANDILTPLSSYNRDIKFKEDFKYFMSSMDTRIKLILYQDQCSFKRIINSLKNQAINTIESHGFLQLMHKFNQVYYRFDEQFKARRTETEGKLFELVDKQGFRSSYFIRKFKVLQHVEDKQKDIWLIFDKDSFVRSVEELEAVSQIFISISKKMNLLRVEMHDSQKIINKYSYVIQRLIQQCKIISLILYKDRKIKEAFDNINMGMVDIFRPLMDEVFKRDQTQDSLTDLKIKFVPRLDSLIKHNRQVITFLEPLINSNQDIRFKVGDSIIKYAKGIDKNISTEQKHYLIEKTLQYRNNFFEYHQNLMMGNNRLKINNCVELIFKLSNLLGNLLLGFSQYQLARQIFASINNVSCVLNIFEIELKNQSNQVKSKHLYLQYALYAQQYQRIELAIRCYQEAYSRTQKYEQMQQISKNIWLLGTSKTVFNTGSYLDRLHKKQYCKDLSDNIKTKIRQKYKSLST